MVLPDEDSSETEILSDTKRIIIVLGNFAKDIGNGCHIYEAKAETFNNVFPLTIRPGKTISKLGPHTIKGFKAITPAL